MARRQSKPVKPRGRPQAAAQETDTKLPALPPAAAQETGDTDDDTWADVLTDAELPAAESAAPAKAPAPPASAKPKAAKSNAVALRVQPARVLSFDTNKNGIKLSRKQEEDHSAKWYGANNGAAVDAYFQGVFEVARKESGHRGVYMGAGTKTLVIGIPMFAGHDDDALIAPGCLPMEHLIAQDVFPLGIVLQLVGKYGTFKSGIIAEFGRWFDLSGGGTELNENETKFSPEWYESIMGPRAFGRMQLHRCESVQDWQRSTTSILRRHKRLMLGTKEAPGPGRTIPVLVAVDSVMGKMSEETQETILGKRSDKNPDQRGETGTGAAARSFPLEAQLIAKYMRTIPHELDRWPFALVLVNHLRIGKDEMGHDVRTKGGGEQVNFQESFELEMQKAGGHKKRIEGANFEGAPLIISCEKSSFGPTHRKIQTRVLWWEEEDENGQWYQRTVWDWDWATVHLLNNLRNGPGSPRIKQTLREMDFHIDCPKTSDIENLAWSANLGMKAKDALPWQDVGRMIRHNLELMDQLRKALRIRRRSLMEGDYLRQLNQLAEDL